jgi:hypothetical protein
LKAKLKLLSFHGPSHFLEVPGFFTIGRGEAHEIDEHLAEAVFNANPDLDITITDLSADAADVATPESQPEAQEGEGQPTASTDQKE